MELHLTNLVPDQLIKALCNTLIHSLWQGLILAAVTGLTIVLTKKASAALRYNLMISFLILFSAGITFTFFMQLNIAGHTVVTPTGISTNAQLVHVANNNAAEVEQHGNILSNCISYFNAHSDTIVLIWFLIICARCVQLAAGLHNVYYIKRSKVLSAGLVWEDKVEELANKLGIKRTVKIMQSGIAKLPMVLGHFKPVILIPVGLLTALSTEEVESILVHELAHIRRKDYLVNLLQNLMEIVFFFNPAVLWVSALIKTERENCCDDIVVAQTYSKVSYIRALVSCQEYQSAMPAFAMGLGGNSDHFLQRVKRMLSNNNQSLNKMEKMVLTICLISAVLLTAAFSKDDKGHAVTRPIIKNIVSSYNKVFKKDSVIRQNTLGKKDSVIKGTDSLKVYKNSELRDGSMLRFTKRLNYKLYLTYLIKKDGVLYQYTSLDDNSSATYYIDGNVIPQDKLAQYQPTFDRLMSECDAALAKKPAAPRAPTALQLNGGKGEITDDADLKAKANDDIQNKNDANDLRPLTQLKYRKAPTKKKLDSLKLTYPNRLALKKVNMMGLKGPLTTLDTQRAIAAYKMARMDSNGRAWVKKPMVLRPYKDGYSNQYKGDYDAKYRTDIQPKVPASPIIPKVALSPPVARVAMPAEPASPPSPVNTVGDGITDQLLKDHLIKDKNNYTFKITNDALYIDGVKQPDEIHKEIVNKFLKPGDKINLTRTNTTKNN